MSNVTTKSDKSVKVVSDARAEEIISIFRTLHGKVLTALQECDIKPLFPDTFAKCGAEDYKLIQQQSRALISAHRTAKWEARISGVRTGIAAVIDTYMGKARAAKSQFDALKATMGDAGAMLPAFPSTVTVPVSDIVGCWPQGTDMGAILRDLSDLKFQVGEKDKSYFIKVAFAPEAPKAEKVGDEPTKTDTVAEEAPKSGEVETKAA